MDSIIIGLAFSYLIAAMCTFGGMLCWSHKAYNQAFAGFTMAMFGIAAAVVHDVCVIDYIPIWATCGDCAAGCIIMVMFALSASKTTPPKETIEEAKNNAAAVLADMARPMFQQMVRLIWKLRLMYAQLQLQYHHALERELRAMMKAEGCESADYVKHIDELAKVTGQIERWTRCSLRISYSEGKYKITHAEIPGKDDCHWC